MCKEYGLGTRLQYNGMCSVCACIYDVIRPSLGTVKVNECAP